MDPRDPGGKRGLHTYNNASIWVNAQGKRFVRDGAPDPKAQVPALLRQSPASYWAIFDAHSRQQFFVSGSDWNDTNVVQREIFANPKLADWVKRADSLEALAQTAGLPVAALVETVGRWNEMIEHGEDTEFHRFDRSNAQRPAKLDTAPFYSVQLFPLARKSLGGVKVDLSCRVFDRQNQQIAGLYAVGELAGVGGINGQAALEGTMLGPAILMGRVAAKDVVGKLRRPLKALPPKPAPEPVTLAQSRATEAGTLRTWREGLRQLLSPSRPGYYHFENAHAVVLAQSYDCVRCHREALPLALTEDKLDRRALIQSCAICHGGVKE